MCVCVLLCEYIMQRASAWQLGLLRVVGTPGCLSMSRRRMRVTCFYGCICCYWTCVSVIFCILFCVGLFIKAKHASKELWFSPFPCARSWVYDFIHWYQCSCAGMAQLCYPQDSVIKVTHQAMKRNDSDIRVSNRVCRLDMFVLFCVCVLCWCVCCSCKLTAAMDQYNCNVFCVLIMLFFLLATDAPFSISFCAETRIVLLFHNTTEPLRSLCSCLQTKQNKHIQNETNKNKTQQINTQRNESKTKPMHGLKLS